MTSRNQRPGLGRRSFMAMCSAGAMLHALPARARPTDPDVVIIGAGAAGIAAAHVLRLKHEVELIDAPAWRMGVNMTLMLREPPVAWGPYFSSASPWSTVHRWPIRK